MSNPDKVKSILDGLTRSIRSNRGVRLFYDYEMDWIKKVIIAIGQGYHRDFVLDENNTQSYEQIIRYFFADETFNGDLEKGLLLIGPKGSGKTLAMLIMNHVISMLDLDAKEYPGTNKKVSFELVRTMNITEKFETTGHDGIIPYKSFRVFCFDDLGEEDKNSKFYLNQINVMMDILTERNLKFLRNGLITHATSNYPLEDAKTGTRYYKDFYGDRVDDRIKQMFNVIVFKGNSRRS